MSARIEPEWAEKLAPHLVKRTYSEPHWSSKRGSAMAYERVTLYGVPLVTGRAVTYSRIDPEASRDLFIRHALVQGEWQTNHKFFHENRALLDNVEELENRARRRDILVDDETLYEFYDERIGQEAVSAKHFDQWWKTERRKNPSLLTFTPETVVNSDAAAVLGGEYPDAWRQGDMQFPLTYQFEPGKDDDGVSAHIPVGLLAQLQPVGFDWLVPRYARRSRYRSDQDVAQEHSTRCRSGSGLCRRSIGSSQTSIRAVDDRNGPRTLALGRDPDRRQGLRSRRAARPSSDDICRRGRIGQGSREGQGSGAATTHTRPARAEGSGQGGNRNRTGSGNRLDIRNPGRIGTDHHSLHRRTAGDRLPSSGAGERRSCRSCPEYAGRAGAGDEGRYAGASPRGPFPPNSRQ